MTIESRKYTITVTLDREDLKDLADLLSLASMQISDLSEDKKNASVAGRKKRLEAWEYYLKRWVPE